MFYVFMNNELYDIKDTIYENNPFFLRVKLANDASIVRPAELYPKILVA